MRPLDVVMTEPGPKRFDALPRAGVRDSVRPATNQRLNETFGFAVGLRPIRPRPDEAHARPRRALLEALTDIAAAVVREDALHDDAASSKPPDGSTQEAGGGHAGLVR